MAVGCVSAAIRAAPPAGAADGGATAAEPAGAPGAAALGDGVSVIECSPLLPATGTAPGGLGICNDCGSNGWLIARTDAGFIKLK
jgi:hypothetical protein